MKDRWIWTDRSTLNIPWYFYLTSLQLADVVSRWEGGTEDQVLSLRDQAEAFYVTAQGGSVSLALGGEG